MSNVELSNIYFLIFSHFLIHKSKEASLGIFQPLLGDKDTDPTLTPSGIQDRLNCWVKNLL